MLDFDYELIQGQRLERALGRMPLAYDDGAVSFDNILLVLEKCSLLLSVDAETDELSIALEGALESNNSEGWVRIKPLEGQIGSEIGWLWLAKNWMGYVDMVTLSFSGIEPDIAILGAASKLSLHRIQKLIG